jgi:hypothetical protein
MHYIFNYINGYFMLLYFYFINLLLFTSLCGIYDVIIHVCRGGQNT